MEIMTKEDAAARGLNIYWTGRACRKGHTSGRYVKTGACRDCVAGYARDRVNTINRIAAEGYTAVEVHVPPDQVEFIRDVAASLLAAAAAKRKAEFAASCYARDLALAGKTYADAQAAKWADPIAPEPFLNRS